MLPLVALLAAFAADTTGSESKIVRAIGGDSVAAGVTFSGTGGTITSAGLYTAGQRPGTFRVIATSSGISDTVIITLVSASMSTSESTPATPPAHTMKVGIPFGLFGARDGFVRKPNTKDFTLSTGMIGPDELVQRLEALRATNQHLLLTMTGGAHANYKTDGVFDMNKWKSRMNQYNTPAIKAAVMAAVADGTLIGNSVLDEPHNRATGAEAANSWGPAGTLTKTIVDQMCGYVKAMFPTLPVGVVHDHAVFEPANSYKVCEFLVDQYALRKGKVTQFRDDALAMGKRDGIAIVFSLNILNGGIQAAREGSWNCPITSTGGRGTYQPNCRMTAAQVRDLGLVLGPAGCALTMWRYDPSFMANPENQQAFTDVAAALAKAQVKPCRKIPVRQ